MRAFRRLLGGVVAAAGLVACVGGPDNVGADASLDSPSAVDSPVDATDAATDVTVVDVAADAPPAACTGTCVPQLPVGWSGPVAVAVGAPSTLPTACGNGLGSQSLSGNAQLQPENAVCSSCTTSPTGQYCKVIADLTFPDSSNNYNCASPTNPNYDISSYGACAPLEFLNQYPAANLHNPYTVAGTCTPPAQNPTVPAPKWGQGAIGCDMLPATGACSAGTVCKGTPPSPFGAQACVYGPGDVACPSGYDTGYRGVVYSGVVDTRTCTACTESYHDQGCTGNLIGNTATNCTGSNQGTITWGGNWTANSPVYCYGFNAGVKNNMTVLNPGCTAGGGQPSGTITPDATKATTICCTQ